jgi:hypothetical protein
MINWCKGIRDITVYLESGDKAKELYNREQALEAMKLGCNFFYKYPDEEESELTMPSMKLTNSAHIEGYMYHTFIDFDRNKMWE